ncbi:MAG: hypothetical protein U0Q55_07170 [Vicinamibacterales bacterium]
MPDALSSGTRRSLPRVALGVALCLGLTWFYVSAATTHARTVNLIKSRGDQTGYLIDAKRIYSNWHGGTDDLIGERMRMPAYPAFLALLYSPSMSDDAFFEAAREWNVWLSVALLCGLAAVFVRSLPLLPAVNLTLVVAFGYFIFKAGYSQPELLSYAVFFAMFLASCALLMQPREQPAVRLAVLAGLLGGATHLTKAVMPPFLGAFGAAYVGQELWILREARLEGDSQRVTREVRATVRRLAALALMLAVFTAVVFPYISTSKRVFGSYFFNANTAYYIWYDTGAQARALLLPHTDQRGVIDIPVEQLPTMSTYLATRTTGQIAQRFTDGIRDMAVRAFADTGFGTYLTLYLAAVGAVLLSCRREALALARVHAGPLVFLALYAVVFTASTAFFSAISGTGTGRFLLMHATPALFTLSWLLTREPFSRCTWQVGSATVTVGHVHLFITATLAVDLAFFVWPRLMTTYGGF